MGLFGFWRTWIVLLIVCGGLTLGVKGYRVSSVCPVDSVVDSIFKLREFSCPTHGAVESNQFSGVIEGDEVLLKKALNLVQDGSYKYIALLFYASWCPFSRIFWPSFSTMSSLYTGIPHIAIEESAVRQSILSKYGVHGFPNLLLLNSTMRVCYHGSRTIGSLVAFYHDVTGIKPASPDQVSLEKDGLFENYKIDNDAKHESCAFSWARSPENLFHQDTYLALATVFVVLRLLYFLYPTMLVCAQCNWRRHLRNLRLWNLLEHPLAFLNKIIQFFSSLKGPCKQRNLQGGARNARAWASRSLATVSIRDGASSRDTPLSECR